MTDVRAVVDLRELDRASDWEQERETTAVALVGTYPPTACGLATFTSNLRGAIAGSGTTWTANVVRVVDEDVPEDSGDVIAHWVAGDRQSLLHAQRRLEQFDAVLLQHEYGLFGGEDGDEVLDLVSGLSVPLVAVLHTALLEPSTHQRHVLEHLIDAASLVVVQSEAARLRILAVHGADPEQILVVPHGAAPNFSGPKLDDMPSPSVLTWGLLSPGKGIEHGIAAMARLAERRRATSYIVAGQTHPKVLALHGESYREALQGRAQALGIPHMIHFDDRYRDWSSLRTLVRTADAVLLPYDSVDQVSSGVLVEAVASGKPVVATRFPHAEELLADGAGILVRHGDVEGMAEALERVLHEPGLAPQMASAARVAAQPLLWPNVGEQYRSLISRVIGARAVA
ncbi:MAG: glycosyltransferase [Actinomycetota bacterium]